MTFLDAINNTSATLKDLGFNLKDSKDLGMHKYATFTNGLYDVYYSYDRGGIEFVAHIKNGDRLDVISLINWLYKNPNKNKFPKIGQFTDEVTIQYFADLFSKEFEVLANGNRLSTNYINRSDLPIKIEVNSKKYFKNSKVVNGG